MTPKAKLQFLRALKANLKKAQENLGRWESLGTRLDKTHRQGWRNVANIRKQEVKSLERLIKNVEHSA